MKDVFEVVEVRQIADNRWLVRGRAYALLKVGETVLANTTATDHTTTLYPFQIVEISTYGRAVDFLESIYTGDLLLEGEHGEVLKSVPTLVKP